MQVIEKFFLDSPIRDNFEILNAFTAILKIVLIFNFLRFEGQYA